MKIIVQIKNVYGTNLVYPVCEHAKTFAKLVNQATLTPTDIGLIKSLGYTVEVQSHPTTL